MTSLISLSRIIRAGESSTTSSMDQPGRTLENYYPTYDIG